MDADTLYPNKNTKLSELAPKIVSYGTLKSKKRNSPEELRALVVEYDESSVGLEIDSSELISINSDRNVKFHSLIVIISFFIALQQITALRLLPHLMPNPKRKLSKSEIANSFCPYFKVTHFLCRPII